VTFEYTPEAATEEPKSTSKFVTEDKSAKVVNLTGEAALLGAGKRQKKKVADEAKKREEESQALKERILKAKRDFATESVRKEAEEKRIAKQLRVEGKTLAQKEAEDR